MRNLHITNKKIKGAKKHIYDEVNFDSALEVNCYKLLKVNNIPFRYNEDTYELVPSFRLNKVNFYHVFGKKNKEFKQVLTKDGLKMKIPAMTLTPDFFIEIPKYIIIIETKGFANDVYPYKRKLLFKYLENLNIEKEIYYFEPKNIKQVEQCITIIKSLINE